MARRCTLLAALIVVVKAAVVILTVATTSTTVVVVVVVSCVVRGVRMRSDRRDRTLTFVVVHVGGPLREPGLVHQIPVVTGQHVHRLHKTVDHGPLLSLRHLWAAVARLTELPLRRQVPGLVHPHALLVFDCKAVVSRADTTYLLRTLLLGGSGNGGSAGTRVEGPHFDAYTSRSLREGLVHIQVLFLGVVLHESLSFVLMFAGACVKVGEMRVLLLRRRPVHGLVVRKLAMLFERFLFAGQLPRQLERNRMVRLDV
mmetsp:Transcript_41137/g.103686  ORF Transcript_41137/g.103686 Transcript_41137/m.103686 type:complete len:257 (-) Transcript_41137:12-782(-)